MPEDSKNARPVEIDSVLPPDAKGKTSSKQEIEHASEVSRIIAHWMDEFIHIPGTSIRIGLDPIIGLVPGIGALLSSSVSFVVLAEGVRHRVPLFVLMRMGLNVLINDALDSLPIVGDAASIFFRSNTRNLALLNQWKAGEQEAVKRGSRLFLFFFFFVWLSLIFLWATVWVLIAGTVWQLLKKLGGVF